MDVDVSANEVKMEVDEALEKLGAIGRWQILHYTVICIARSGLTCLHMLAIIYIGNQCNECTPVYSTLHIVNASQSIELTQCMSRPIAGC